VTVRCRPRLPGSTTITHRSHQVRPARQSLRNSDLLAPRLCKIASTEGRYEIRRGHRDSPGLSFCRNVRFEREGCSDLEWSVMHHVDRIDPRFGLSMTAFDPRGMTGPQLRAARALLGISAQRLADLTKLGIMTIRRAERSRNT
jgi:hypothetical protein